MNNEILMNQNILLDQQDVTKEAAIRKAGQLLVKGGYVDSSYIDGMFEREKVYNTYIGNGVAIPHGVSGAKAAVKNSGIVVLQYKDGLDYDGEIAYFVIGIAGKGDEHLDILSQIAISIQDEDSVRKAARSSDKEEVMKLLMSE